MRQQPHILPGMRSRYLPLDRRDLQQYMVDRAVANLFIIFVSVKLFDKKSVDRDAMNFFSKSLFKIAMRRHTNLWRKDPNGHYYADQWNEAQKSSSLASEATQSTTI